MLPEDSDDELFVMLKYTVQCANIYFRLLHHSGLWLSPRISLRAARACDELCDTLLQLQGNLVVPQMNNCLRTLSRTLISFLQIRKATYALQKCVEPEDIGSFECARNFTCNCISRYWD